MPRRAIRDRVSTLGLSLALAKRKGGAKMAFIRVFQQNLCWGIQIHVVLGGGCAGALGEPCSRRGGSRVPRWFMSLGMSSWRLQQTQTIAFCES